MSNGEERYANVTVYLQNFDTKKLFGLCNRHVINKARECQTSLITVCTTNELRHFSIGKPVEIPHDTNNYDVDIFEVLLDDSFAVSNEIQDENVVTKQVCLYEGSIENLLGKRVRKLRPGFSYFKVNNDDTSTYGHVYNKEEHRSLGSNLNFLVKGENGKFAREGDCGSPVVLVDTESEKLQIVGLIGGGTNNRNDTFCIFLPAAVKHLEKVYNMNLTTKLSKLSSAVRVPVGCRIYANCQSKCNFTADLAELAIDIADEEFSECDLDKFPGLVKLEKDMKSELYNGTFNRKLESDNPSSVAIYHCCRALYSMMTGQFLDSDHDLKMAILSTVKCPDIKLWLFAKILSNLTQHFALFDATESRNFHEQLFIMAILFHDENIKTQGFPKETGSKILLHLSQAFQKLYSNKRNSPKTRRMTKKILQHRTSAIKWVRQAVEKAERIHNIKQTTFSYGRLVRIKIELAYALLGCGHFFASIREDEVTEEEIQEAQSILQEIQEIILCNNAELECQLLIVKCDLAYRLGKYKEAFSFAEQCYDIALTANIRLAKFRAHRRKSIIQELLTSISKTTSAEKRSSCCVRKRSSRPSFLQKNTRKM